MDLITIGKNYFPGIKIPLVYVENDNFSQIKENTDYYSIIFATKGNGILGINNKNKIFTTPSIFCFNEKSSVELIKSNDLEIISIYFNPKFVNDLLSIENINNKDFISQGSLLHDLWLMKRIFVFESTDYMVINISPPTFERVKCLIKQIYIQHINQDNPFWPCRGRSYFIELLILIERLYENNDIRINEFIPSKELEDIYPVISYLANQYHNKITINDLTNQFFTNRTTLNTKFINAIGFSPINYLIKLRIQVASLLLKDTSIPISEITERTGFDDLTHFGRMFKKYMGVNPSFYRDNFKLPSYLQI
jgi:AraC-like DNA-binding protein